MILDLNSLKTELEKLRRERPEIKIVTTNGAFDILHVAHVKTLEESKKLGDVLIVLLNSDSSIKTYKGKKRPIIPERERAELLSALKPVDYVCIFSEDRPLNLLAQIKPDFHVKGGSFMQDRVEEEKKFLATWGGKFLSLPRIDGLSTTNIIEKILDNYKQKK